MITIEEVLYILLKAAPGVTGVVSGRIFSVALPDTVVYPLLLVRPPESGGRRRVRVIQGGCAMVEQSVYIYSASLVKAEASRLDYAVVAALDEYPNSLITDDSSPPREMRILSIFATQLSHAYQYDDLTKTHQFLTEFLCTFLDPMLLEP